MSIAVLVMLIAFSTQVYCEPADESAEQIRRPEGVVTDRDVGTLLPPPTLKDDTGFDIARTPSTIRFSVVKGCEPYPEDNKGVWSSWSESILASDGNYYSAISDHRGVDGRTFIVRYDPESGEQTRVFDSYALFSHTPGTYGHGKLHGRLDEYPPGYIMAATYWGIPPLDTKFEGELWTGEIPGGHLIRVNMAKGTTEDLGVPFKRDSWPMHATDTKRGIFYGIGYDRHFLAYDLDGMRPLYAALPPPNVLWFERATLTDETSGNCYSTSRERLVKYNPESNTMTHLAAETPDNPHNDDPAASMRCYTSRRTADGYYLCQTMDGMIFKFFPDTETVETVDVNWGDGYYCTSMALSPGDRYVYYTVDVHGSSFEHGCPVVQYDLIKKRRKAIAFLHPYYDKQYGYVFGGSYSVTLNADGSRLFITWNGKFQAGDDVATFGDPTIMLIDVPRSERVE